MTTTTPGAGEGVPFEPIEERHRAGQFVWPFSYLAVNPLEGKRRPAKGRRVRGLLPDGVMFDFDGDGVKTLTGWVAPDDGFLVFDRNGDGIINDGRELFGNHTQRYDGTGTCRDGYEALAQKDTNGDGVVNHLDDNWQHFQVWRDLNQNGITDEGELFTLEELGITGFEVGHNGENTEQNGNTLQGEAVYYDVNGDSHSFTDAWFVQDSFYTEYPDMEIPEHLKDLPLMNGSGNVRPILQACAGDEALAAIYRQMSEAGDRQGQMALVENLLYAWASTSGMVNNYEARARACGAEGVSHDALPMSVGEWDRILHVVQAFNGRYLVDLPDFTGITGYKCVRVKWTNDMINKILNASGGGRASMVWMRPKSEGANE